MAHACRVLAVLLLAVVVARASVTVTWNTHAPHVAGTSQQTAAQNARVIRVDGTRVLLELPDGSTRNYTTTPQQARMLRGLIGTRIEFRVSPGSQ